MLPTVAPAHIGSAGRGPAQQLCAGSAWVRLCLRATLPGLCATVALLTAVVGPSTSALAQSSDPVRGIENDVENVRTSALLIDNDLRTAMARERKYPLDRRFIEATLAYERGNLSTASVLLTDLVSDAEFQKMRDYGDALYMLGDSMYRMRNYLGAKRYLDLILRQTGSPHYQPALQALADIAVRLRRMEEVEDYAKRLTNVPAGQRKSELLYQFGRSFFSAGSYDRAVSFLEQIAVGEVRWPHAHFYIGAAHVAKNRIPDATREFLAVVANGKNIDEARKTPQEVLDFANIALGRLYLQDKQYDDAALHYQAVDRNSPVYEESLFELAATYVAAKKADKALETLDVLLLTVSDDNVAVQAAVLRGRINMLNKSYDAADASYQDVVDRYSAITGELTRFASSDKNLEQFFTWLLNRGSDEYSVVRPVSDRVARYIENDEDIQRVVALFDEMSAERAEVKEASRLAATIEAALKESSRLDMFPELKDGWMRVVENQNRSVDTGRRIVELLRTYAEPRMTAEERIRADALRAERKRLEEAFAKVPATKGDYIERQRRVDSGFANLAADVGILKTQLAGVKDQVLAVEKMLNERVFGEQGLVLPKDRENEIRTELQAAKDEVRRIFRDIEALTQDVEVYAQGVGAGDKVSRDESTVRVALLATQRAEQMLYATILERTGERSNEVVRLRVARTQLEQIGVGMEGSLAVISSRAGERLAGIAKILTVEKRNIAEYQVTVRAYEDNARSLSRDVGFGMIRNAQRRLADILLEADLGLVDVAWQRKQEKTSAIRELQEERTQRIRTLGEILDNLTNDGGAE